MGWPIDFYITWYNWQRAITVGYDEDHKWMELQPSRNGLFIVGLLTLILFLMGYAWNMDVKRGFIEMATIWSLEPSNLMLVEMTTIHFSWLPWLYSNFAMIHFTSLKNTTMNYQELPWTISFLHFTLLLLLVSNSLLECCPPCPPTLLSFGAQLVGSDTLSSP